MSNYKELSFITTPIPGGKLYLQGSQVCTTTHPSCNRQATLTITSAGNTSFAHLTANGTTFRKLRNEHRWSKNWSVFSENPSQYQVQQITLDPA